MPIEAQILIHKTAGLEPGEKVKLSPGEEHEFNLDRWDIDSLCIVSCKENDTGEIVLRSQFFAVLEDAQDNMLDKIHLEARIPVEKGSTRVINRRALTRVEVKHVPSE